MAPDDEVDRGRRGLLLGRRLPPRQRPPWADAEAFAALCTRCGGCVAACPEGIIAAGDGGFPEVRFARGECTFCGDCARACPQPIFRPDRRPWDLVAAIGEACLSLRGIVCRSCQDACPERAVRFRPRLGGGADLSIDAPACTGCGACVSACPVEAVAVRPVPEDVHGR